MHTLVLPQNKLNRDLKFGIACHMQDSSSRHQAVKRNNDFHRANRRHSQITSYRKQHDFAIVQCKMAWEEITFSIKARERIIQASMQDLGNILELHWLHIDHEETNMRAQKYHIMFLCKAQNHWWPCLRSCSQKKEPVQFNGFLQHPSSNTITIGLTLPYIETEMCHSKDYKPTTILCWCNMEAAIRIGTQIRWRVNQSCCLFNQIELKDWAPMISQQPVEEIPIQDTGKWHVIPRTNRGWDHISPIAGLGWVNADERHCPARVSSYHGHLEWVGLAAVAVDAAHRPMVDDHVPAMEQRRDIHGAAVDGEGIPHHE